MRRNDFNTALTSRKTISKPRYLETQLFITVDPKQRVMKYILVSNHWHNKKLRSEFLDTLPNNPKKFAKQPHIVPTDQQLNLQIVPAASPKSRRSTL